MWSKRHSPKWQGIVVSILLLVSCTNSGGTPPAPTDTPNLEPTQTHEVGAPTPTLDPDAPTFPIQIRILTTSTHTTLTFKSGGQWVDLSIVSQDGDPSGLEIEGDQISFGLGTGKTPGIDSVEIVVEATLGGLEDAQPLIFEVERDRTGSTQVEIIKSQDENSKSIANFTWDGRKPSGANSQTFEVSPLAFLGRNPNEYTVIAQLNFWYYGEGEYGGFENPDGSRSTRLTPLYGDTYYASDPHWIYKQIEWAVEYGVDAFSIEWTTPRGVGCCGSMEDVLDDVFLESPNIHKIRWAIFYDFVLRMLQTEGLSWAPGQILNFDEPDVYNTFVDDFVHFATKYFDHPQYLTIDGRPVIYVWATNAFTGNIAGAIAEARQKVADLGYDVFIVGDEVCYTCFNAAHAALFDGSSTFTFLIPGVQQELLQNVGQAVETTDQAFNYWRHRIANLKVTGRDDFVNFQPAWAPQYDDSWNVERQDPKTILAENLDQVIAMAEVARKYAQPAGSEGVRLIWVNTWNCWAETTTIEPTIEGDPKYPGGNYGFDFLEAIRDVYGVETYYTSP